MKSENLYEFGFRNRLDAMIGLAGLWADELGDDSSVSSLLKEFSEFACRYFREIEHRVVEEAPPDIFDVALNRLQQEWVTISQVCQQRKVKQLEHFLKEADDQAQRYYERFIGFQLGDKQLCTRENATPITYFEKIYGITRYAFTPFPLISIPFQYLHTPERWQALAHEIGHHLYWNACPLDSFKDLHKQLKETVSDAIYRYTQIETFNDLLKREKLVDIWLLWLEETFADITGVLLCGKSYVVSCIELAEMATNYDVARLIADDREHPSWFIRPSIAIETLNWMHATGKVEDINVSNLSSWEQRLAEIQDRQGRLLHQPSGLSISEIKSSVAPIVKALLEEGVRVGHAFEQTPVHNSLARSSSLSEVIAQVTARATLIFESQHTESFDDLLNYLKTRAAAELKEKNLDTVPNREQLIEEAVYYALLTLQLSSEDLVQGDECRWEWVRTQGGRLMICPRD